MRFYPLFIFLFIFLNSLNVCADEPVKKTDFSSILSGHVMSGENHIPFASISIKGTTIGTAADASGHFKLSDLPAGNQTIVVTAVGFKPITLKLDLIPNSSFDISAELEPDIIGIEQVVISADRNAKSRANAPTIVNSITPKLFLRTQSVTLSEGLNYSPGLRMENNCQNCGFSQLRMNGLEGPYTQILINSRPVFSGLAGVYGLELIPANMIERVEIVRGGGSAMYGSNAIAGTVNLITKDPVYNSFTLAGNYGTLGQVKDKTPTGDINLNLNGSYVSGNYKTGLTLFGFYRDRNPFDANNDGFTELASIHNKTLGARFYQRILTRGKLTFDYFYIDEFRRGGNKFELPLHEADITESVNHSIHSGAATFDLLRRDADKLSIFFSGQQVDRDSYYGANQDPSAYGKTKDFTFAAGLQYLWQMDNLIFAPASIISGLESNGSWLQDDKLGYFDVMENVQHGNTRVTDQQLSTQSAFVQSDWLGNKWVLTTGFRYDYYQVNDNTDNTQKVIGNVISPRLIILYNVNKHLQVRTGYARGFRAPQIFDEDLHIETSGSRQVLHRNDPDLKQETSGSYTFSLNYTYDEGKWQYQFLAEAFYTRLNNPFANEYGSPDENGVVIYTRTNAEKSALVKGINLEFNTSPSNRWQMQSGFTFQKSIFEEPQEFDEARFFRSPDKYGYMSLNFKPALRFNVSATANYTGSMLVPYFGPEQLDPALGELRNTQAFFDAGIKATYIFKMIGQVNMEWSAGIKNITNSFQNDFDTGIDRDPSYIYGPAAPRTIYFGIRIGNIL